MNESTPMPATTNDASGAKPRVTMYTAAYCGYCRRAERLLEAKGVDDIDRIKVDERPDARATMIERTGRRTVPQIYIGDFHVGGYDELAALDRAGRLDALLADEADEAAE
jgi:glutaredoxin 3